MIFLKLFCLCLDRIEVIGIGGRLNKLPNCSPGDLVGVPLDPMKPSSPLEVFKRYHWDALISVILETECDFHYRIIVFIWVNLGWYMVIEVRY